MKGESDAILTLTSVSKTFDAGGAGLARLAAPGRRRKLVRAVADVSLALGRREVLGLVGESGCGKSTLGRIIAGLIQPSVGTVQLGSMALPLRSFAERRRWAKAVQMIFQNPYASLNPRRTVRETIEEPLRVHGIASARQLRERTDELLANVGLDAALADRRPHQMSGGQCQRVGIARALTVLPEVLVCDEPVSALDVSVQAQILNLLADLKDRLTVAYLFISHDLGVVQRLSDRVAVMYLGRIVEIAPKDDLFERPQHPYTQLLLDSVPRIGRRAASGSVSAGEQPSPMNPPSGCYFHPRCPLAGERCRNEAPALKPSGHGRSVACHLHD